jgi:ubiquinone biosynthesis protein Coq4
MDLVTSKEGDGDRPSPSGPLQRRELNATEAGYMRGSAEPVTSSVLISSSKYLNNPYYRDAFAQFALRRFGRDLPETYLIPNMVRALSECRDDAEFAALVEAEKAKTPAFARWLDARRHTDYDPAQMQDYKDGTLGAAIRDFITKSGMEMQFMMKGMPVRTDLEYIKKRRVSHHDIEHMVTGFGPNELGEQALSTMNVTSAAAAFTPKLAQYLSEANTWVTATSYYRVSLHGPALMPHMLEAMRRGIAAGQAIRTPLIMVAWEDYLDWSLEDICSDLGFERGPGEDWAWSREASLS